MALKSKKSKEVSSPNIVGRLIRSLAAVVVLSAFVLTVSYVIKGASEFDIYRFEPLLSRIGIDSSEFSKVAGIFNDREGGGSKKSNLKESENESKETSGSADISAASTVRGEDGAPGEVKAEEDNKPYITVSLMSDSHESNDLLAKALEIASQKNIGQVFYLGDYTDLGVEEALISAKKVMDNSGLKYYSLPGDHDLWKTVGPENFIKVFGKNYQSVTLGGFKFVLLDNSANYTAIDSAQMDWFTKEVEDADFVLIPQPLYHPTNTRVMGVVNGEEVKELRKQALEILNLIRKSKVKAVIAGDHHGSSTSSDPEKSDLKHIVVGALTKTRAGDGVVNLQTPRFSLLEVYNDDSFEVEEIVLQ